MICSLGLVSDGFPTVPSDEATINSIIGHAKLRGLNKYGAINNNNSAKTHRIPRQKLKSTKAAKPTSPPAKKVTSMTKDGTIKNKRISVKSAKLPRTKSKSINKGRPHIVTSIIRTPKPSPRPSSKPNPAPSEVAEKNTYVFGFSASFPMITDSIRRQLRRLALSYYALGEVMKRTITQLILRRGTLTFGQTLKEVNIISANIVDQVLLAEFNIVVEDLCTQSCASQVGNTTLNDSIQTVMNDTFQSGEFVMTLQNIANATRASEQNGTYANDTLLRAVDKLNATAAAIKNMTTSVTIRKPSLSPSRKPRINPSGNPSQHPSNNPSGNPSKDPSCNPSEHHSMNPSEHPSLRPSDSPTSPTVDPTSANPTYSSRPTTTSTPTLNPQLIAGQRQTVSISSDGKNKTFFIAVPRSNMITCRTAGTTGASGDADLYVKFDSQPTSTSQDAISTGGSNDEVVGPLAASTTTDRTLYVMVHAYEAFVDVQLWCDLMTSSPTATPTTRKPTALPTSPRPTASPTTRRPMLPTTRAPTTRPVVIVPRE
jgi:hypothetical protein